MFSYRSLVGFCAQAVVYTLAEFWDLHTKANTYAVQVTMLGKPIASAR